MPVTVDILGYFFLRRGIRWWSIPFLRLFFGEVDIWELKAINGIQHDLGHNTNVFEYTLELFQIQVPSLFLTVLQEVFVQSEIGGEYDEVYFGVIFAGDPLHPLLVVDGLQVDG